MDDWIPIFVLPNLDSRGKVECEIAAIVPLDDPRVSKLVKDHPIFGTFLSKFKSQFGTQVAPSILMVHASAPSSVMTPEAVTGLRDVLSLSVVPYARAHRLVHDRRSGFVFASAFQLYPWMLDAKYENIIMANPGEMHLHVVEEFDGQTFAEQSPQTLMEGDVDLALANELLRRWVARFSTPQPDWHSKALFRSLNMANEAAGIPAPTASVFYDVGRSLALWVSACEILAHPGGNQPSNFGTVAAVLESVGWLDNRLSNATYQVGPKPQHVGTLATWIYKAIYELRNDFLHGNDVDGPALLLNGKPIIDFAGCIYRAALTGVLDVRFKEQAPDGDNLEAMTRFVGERRRFNRYQEIFERALLKAI